MNGETREILVIALEGFKFVLSEVQTAPSQFGNGAVADLGTTASVPSVRLHMIVRSLHSILFVSVSPIHNTCLFPTSGSNLSPAHLGQRKQCG